MSYYPFKNVFTRLLKTLNSFQYSNSLFSKIPDNQKVLIVFHYWKSPKFNIGFTLSPTTEDVLRTEPIEPLASLLYYTVCYNIGYNLQEIMGLGLIFITLPKFLQCISCQDVKTFLLPSFSWRFSFDMCLLFKDKNKVWFVLHFCSSIYKFLFQPNGHEK